MQLLGWYQKKKKKKKPVAGATISGSLGDQEEMENFFVNFLPSVSTLPLSPAFIYGVL